MFANEELRLAHNLKMKEYYAKNRELIIAKRNERYYNSVCNNLGVSGEFSRKEIRLLKLQKEIENEKKK